ncbi:hypothetical protein FQR65_LT04673 [Abscondita terminalis]|nr:hypothetical protein FQR65_LT04673 [Abscondita terminalis]
MDESKSRINIVQLEKDAKASATHSVINMFQRPGQLEKVEQYKRRLVRKKASVEALLKSAMQSKLDGVRVGLNQLILSLGTVKKVEANLKSIHNLFAQVPELYDLLSEVRDENMRHSQYVTARKNLKHIFTVPESVKKTEQWINDGKLLHTHQCLRDLENSRDDLLFELHKLPNQSAHDKAMLKACFADVEMLSDLLEKQLRLVLARTLNTVRKEPTVIVTALRIIEREEKADEEALKHYKQSGFMPPGRPKRWKAMSFEILEKAVATRIEGTQIEERDDHKLWLVRYLELIRQLILEDLRVVKALCVPCFPQRYDIINKYVHMYHVSLSKHVQEKIQNGLEGNEYVSVLSWVLNTYKGPELMGHPDLKEHTSGLSLLLPQAVLNNLQDQYLKNMEANYVEWMQNTLISEKQEWRSSNPPEEPRVDRYLRTAAPVIIFQMIDQNLQVTKTISNDLTNKVLMLSLEQIIKYGMSYKDAIVEFKNKHFEDRSQVCRTVITSNYYNICLQVPFFTQYMITIVNNCLQFVELGGQFEKQYLVYGSPRQLTDCFRRFKEVYYQLRDDSGRYLLEEVFLDLDKHFEELFTSARWLQISLPVDTICATLEDYFQDYNRLVESNFKFVLEEARFLVTKRYITAMLSKKVSFKSYEECQTAAKKIFKEVEQLRKVFLLFAPNGADGEDPLDVILLLSEVLKCEDDMISFDLHRLVEQYPDISEDHLHRLLNLRGDLSKADLKEKVNFVTKSSKSKSQTHSSVFSQLVFQDRLINCMGNCLKRSTTDDISLLRGNDSVRESSSDQLGPSLYQEILPIQTATPVYHPSPSVTRPVAQLTEEEQIKIAKRIGLIQHLPTGTYDGCKKARECVICMVEFLVGDAVRYLPCMHTYHMACIDDWLMRSLTCPSCMEPVDAALLTSYETN